MTDNTTPLITLHKVTKAYGSNEARIFALRGIDLSINPGEFISVMGPSGSGKSTCMNILGCLDTPTSGTYKFGGVEVSHMNRKQLATLRRFYLGFVFQGFNLLNRTTAVENVELPLMYRGLPPKERRELARKALAQVGLAGREAHTPGELSGGQQQRVAIARAIATQPSVLFADEPTGNLDSGRSHEIMELLRGLNRNQKITVVMVTHEEEMAAYSDRIIVFRDGQVADQDGDQHPVEKGGQDR